MQRPQPAEVGPGQVEVEDREGELQGDDDADQEADDAPEHGGDHAGADDVVHVAVGRSRVFSGIAAAAEKSMVRSRQTAAAEGDDRDSPM